MVRRLSSSCVSIGVLLVVTTTVTAWNAAGHRLIAMLAYDQMTEDARVEVVRLLRKHPRFEEDFQGEMPQAVRNAASDVQDRWIFSQAAVWPDIARSHPEYHHGTWHYINEPVFLTDSDRSALEDSVKVDDIQSQLKTIREDAVRQLKDRQELFVDGENIIRLGQRNFSVNVQTLDLTTVTRDKHIELHLTGTNFYQPLVDPQLEQARDLWSQEVVSENPQVYRGEYLAFQLLQQILSGQLEHSAAKILKHALHQLRDRKVELARPPRQSITR